MEAKYRNSYVKDLHRQVRGLQKKIDKDKAETEKYKNANKLLKIENSDLQVSQYQNIEELRYQNQQLQSRHDEMLKNSELEPCDHDKELCYFVLQKSIEVENFVENINNILLKNGILCLELSRMQSEAANRIKKVKIFRNYILIFTYVLIRNLGIWEFDFSILG